MTGAAIIMHRGTELHLLPQRAVWWPATRTLIVADVHLGKGTAFRTLGVPVPSGASTKDLNRLTQLLTVTDAARLIVLGDLVHAKRSHQPELTAAMTGWRASHPGAAIMLVRGNHDRSAGRLVAELQIDEVDEPHVDGSLVLRHYPRPDDGGRAVLAGHVHPVMAVQDFDRSVVRIPCFSFDEQGVGILPSFGTFTGGAIVGGEGVRRYACAGAKVVLAK